MPARTGKGLLYLSLWVNLSGFSGQRCCITPSSPRPSLYISPFYIPWPQKLGGEAWSLPC